MQSGDKWFVRNEDGKVFGPCGLDVLAQWSREGRIAPSASVSCEQSGISSMYCRICAVRQPIP